MIKKILIPIILAFIIINPLFPSEIEKMWGLSKNDLMARLKLQNYIVFKPEEKPEYSNRIIDFFSSMNPEGKAEITILRISGKPEIDYCFFNGKLYSVSEEWGNVDKTGAQNLLRTLKEKYTEISSEKKNSDLVYSLKKDKTKVYLYKREVDEKTVHVKIFYYSTNLFSMLLCE